MKCSNRKYFMKNLRLLFYFALFLALCFALYFNKNSAFVYSKMGDFYYKNNQIEKAQAYYEKSFLLGNQDSKQREIYVNSIINSPLTISSQEKLLEFIKKDIDDGASLKAKYFFADLRQEIHRKYPENYILQAPYNQKIVHWSKFPITYSYKNTNNISPEVIEEIDSAFNRWEKEGVVLFTKVSKDSDIVIDFRKNKLEDIDYGKKYVIAYTLPDINLNKLERMDIIFYTQTPDGVNFSRNQIYNTALHEIFHALGFMGHSFDKENIMYLSKDNRVLVNDERLDLTNADIATLRLLYKIKPDITDVQGGTYDYISYLVLGNNDDINSSKTKEAKYYINSAPTLPSGYITLAESYVAKKEYSKAIKALEKALSLAKTKDVEYIIYYDLAVSYFYISNNEMALDYLQKAQQISDTEDLHYLLAEIYLNQNDLKNAILEYEALVNKSPNNINYVVNLTNIYIKHHNYLKARNVLKNYLKKNPAQKENKKLSPYRVLLF